MYRQFPTIQLVEAICGGTHKVDHPVLIVVLCSPGGCTCKSFHASYRLINLRATVQLVYSNRKTQ